MISLRWWWDLLMQEYTQRKITDNNQMRTNDEPMEDFLLYWWFALIQHAIRSQLGWNFTSWSIEAIFTLSQTRHSNIHQRFEMIISINILRHLITSDYDFHELLEFMYEHWTSKFATIAEADDDSCGKCRLPSSPLHKKLWPVCSRDLVFCNNQSEVCI